MQQSDKRLLWADAQRPAPTDDDGDDDGDDVAGITHGSLLLGHRSLPDLTE